MLTNFWHVLAVVAAVVAFSAPFANPTHSVPRRTHFEVASLVVVTVEHETRIF